MTTHSIAFEPDRLQRALGDSVNDEFVDFCFRSWCFQRSGTLADKSLNLVEASGSSFPEFCQNLQNTPLRERLEQEDLGDEFLIAISYNRFDILDFMLTNRKVIYYECEGTLYESKDYRRKVFGLNQLASCEYATVGAFQKSMILTFKDGKREELTVTGGETLLPAVQFALEKGGHDWSGLWKDAGNYQAEVKNYPQSEEGRAAQESLMREKPGAAGYESVFKLITGIMAALLFLLFNGAPLGDGGPALLRWASQDGNIIIVIGALALGWAAPRVLRFK